MGFNGSGKATNSEIDSRVEKCFELMLQEKIKYDDYLKFAKDEYGVHRNQANSIWVKARDMRNEHLLERLEDEIANAVLELEEYENDMLASDSNQADALRLKAKDMKFKIKKLYVERSEITHKGNITINVDFSDNTAI